DRALQACGAHLVEEALAHAREADDAERPRVGKGLDGIGPELRNNGPQACRDLGQRFVPGDALEARVTALGSDSPARIKHSVRAVDVVQIIVDLVAQVAFGDRVCRIAFYFDGAAARLVDGDAHGAGVRTVVRTGHVHNSELALRLEGCGAQLRGIPHRGC